MPPTEVDAACFSPDILEFIRLLHAREVRYVVVGGEAVIYYGHARLTGDIDFFYDSSPENSAALFGVLKDFWSGSIPGIERMEELRGRAHKIIDTTNLTSNQLKEQVRSLFEKEGARNPLTVTIMSFGYKYGIPLDADLIIDVRFLPLTGEDIEVQEFVLQHPQTRSFIRRFASLLNFLIPHYIKEGKKHLVIAIGCTGGQHRSVTMAIKMAELLARKFNVSVKHRDSARHSVEGSNK